jgi:hypothetical protein
VPRRQVWFLVSADGSAVTNLDPSRPGIQRNRSAPFLMTEENAEVFAWYGQAVAIAQFLEDALVETLSSLQPRTQLARSRPKKVREDLSKANLGAIQREMAKHPEFRDAARNLVPLNDLRIELIHHWFTNPERQAKLTSREGRAELVAELRRATKRIGPASAVVFGIAMLSAFPRPTAENDAATEPESDATP